MKLKTVVCTRCKNVIPNRKRLDVVNFCSDKCRKEYDRHQRFISKTINASHSSVDKYKKLLDLEITHTISIRKDHPKHLIVPRRLTVVLFYCKTCGIFTHRRELRPTPTRSELKRAMFFTRQKRHDAHNPGMVKKEMMKREIEENDIDEER